MNFDKKKQISCETCDVTHDYYADASMMYFKIIHLDHNLVMGPLRRSIERKRPIETGAYRSDSNLSDQKTSHLDKQSLNTSTDSHYTITSSRFVDLARKPNEGSKIKEEELPTKQAMQVVEQADRVEKQREVASAKRPAVTTARLPIPPQNDELLLLSKSSYVQRGEEMTKEAVRISNVLRAFRWRIEPTYTIGVLFDDKLSVETSTGVLSRKVITRIEGVGYKLVAINASESRPTAWFRKQGSPTIEDEEEPDHPDLDAMSGHGNERK